MSSLGRRKFLISTTLVLVLIKYQLYQQCKQDLQINESEQFTHNILSEHLSSWPPLSGGGAARETYLAQPDWV